VIDTVAPLINILEEFTILTPAFLEEFDRLKPSDYALLEHLQAHGLLAGTTANDMNDTALIRRVGENGTNGIFYATKSIGCEKLQCF
jgi:hypothetical protein